MKIVHKKRGYPVKGTLLKEPLHVAQTELIDQVGQHCGLAGQLFAGGSRLLRGGGVGLNNSGDLVDTGGHLLYGGNQSLSGIIVLTEGKYHQIKRMFEAVDNKIETLERVTFGPLTLDPTLSRGEWRYLTDDEIALLQSGTKGVDAL